MSIGLTTAFTNAKSSLTARQQEMNLISNNMAKASLENYHRQTSVLTSSATLLTNSGYFGTGVVSSLVRNFNAELEGNLYLSMNSNGYKQSYADVLSNVESLVAPNGTSGLTTVVSAFADSLQDLADSPENMTYRTALVSAASNLSDQFNQQYESLRKMRDSVAYSKDSTDPYAVGGSVKDITDRVNGLLDKLPGLNDAISRMEMNAFLGQAANDLRDERDAVVKELSQYMNVKVVEDGESKYKVSVVDETSGTEIVLINPVFEKATPDANHIVARLDIDAANPDGVLSFEVVDGVTAVATPVELLSETGSLRALQDVREGFIKDRMSELYTYAQTITGVVNTTLAAGEDLDGNAGAPLFTAIAVQPASGNIMKVAAITNRQIAASDVDPTVVGSDIERGNGENMKALWSELNASRSISGTEDTLLNFSNSIIRTVSQATSEMNSQATTTQNAVTMFQNAIFNQSGVNTDQEMTSMLEVQQAYQATAKLLSTIDKLYDMIFSLM